MDCFPLTKIDASLQKKRVSVSVRLHVLEHHSMIDKDPSVAQIMKSTGSQQIVAKEGRGTDYLIEHSARIIQVGLAGLRTQQRLNKLREVRVCMSLMMGLLENVGMDLLEMDEMGALGEQRRKRAMGS